MWEMASVVFSPYDKVIESGVTCPIAGDKYLEIMNFAKLTVTLFLHMKG